MVLTCRVCHEHIVADGEIPPTCLKCGQDPAYWLAVFLGEPKVKWELSEWDKNFLRALKFSPI